MGSGLAVTHFWEEVTERDLYRAQECRRPSVRPAAGYMANNDSPLQFIFVVLVWFQGVQGVDVGVKGAMRQWDRV